MHRFARTLTVATLVLLGVQIISLWSVEFTSPARQINIGLAQGCLRMYIAHGAGNERPGVVPGIVVGPWSADALWWTPEIDAHFRLWVMRPGASAAAQIVGSAVMLPVLYPLGLCGVGAGWAWLLVARRSRRASMVCRECGYDLRGLAGGRCPECGEGFVRRLVRLVSRAWWATSP